MEPFVGEIMLFGGSFAPRGWAQCDGQLLAISGNDALFSLLGTIYGGDGRTTFGLPDLRGRLPLHTGSGPGLTPRNMGNSGGSETASVSQAEMAAHSHSLHASTGEAVAAAPAGAALGDGNVALYATAAATASMDGQASAATGSGQSHNHVMPFQAVNYCIALFGVYPSRN